MFRKTKRRIAAALIVTVLAGGGAAASKEVICQKTGVDLNMFGIENLRNTKEIEKILKKIRSRRRRSQAISRTQMARSSKYTIRIKH